MQPFKARRWLALAICLILAACSMPIRRSTAPPAAPGTAPAPDSSNLEQPEPDAVEETLPVIPLPPELFGDPPIGAPTLAIAPEQVAGLLVESDLTSTGLPPEVGQSRARPYPTATRVITPGWDFQVLEVLRGEAAWQLISAGGRQVAPPPTGKEYLAYRARITCKTGITNYLSTNELTITGSQGLVVADLQIDNPFPEIIFTDIYYAEPYEGWQDGLIDVGEQNPIAVFYKTDELNGGEVRTLFFVALSEGAAVLAPTEDLAAIPRNELGKTEAAPAAPGETVVTPDWEITLLETIRGEAAWQMLGGAANTFQPAEGLEYAAIRARIRNINSDLEVPRFDGTWFNSLGAYRRVFQADLNHPQLSPDYTWLSEGMFPGAQVEGWLYAEVQINDSHPILVFTPEDSDQMRYFYLE